ncbi:hypothetical protein V6N13_099453 [Hibiscus sabdariffa]|uniref:Protein PHYTOCHROME KINASE SUBSTRATE 1-like n=1 Tax=Hibiscus sabdariffa TaxID=183260 RepID=A0ABR2PZP7_9ROSI
MDGDTKKHCGLGEVSFSSYLRVSTAEEIFVHNFADPGVAIGRILQRNMSPEAELSVFGAENYFNTELDDDWFSNKRQMGSRAPQWPGTPSATSEGALLPSFMGNPSVNKQKRIDGRSFFSNLSCTGACSNGKSVHVNPINVDRGRVHLKQLGRKLIQEEFQVKDVFDQTSVRSNREVCFPSPVPKLGKQYLDDPRKSLEVFGSTATKKGDITKNLERKLSKLTWDAIPNVPTRSIRVDNDFESDCSSDLFEIDNIHGDVLASDAKSSCMTPYAPSETSIEWSVTTAGAADCSFVSDHDKKKSKTANATKEAQRSRSGGILGCKNRKAVMVAEAAYTKKIEK